MNFLNLLSLSYWFTLRPGNLADTSRQIAFIVLGAVLLTAVIIKIISRRQKDESDVKFFNKLFNLLLTTGLVSPVLLFFRSENMPFLAARFWWALLFLGDLTWLVFIVKYAAKTMPQEKSDRRHQQAINKYLPK